MGIFIVKGILAGLGISLLVGPLFFGLIQLSVERGVRAGIIFAAGIWISDLIYVRLVQIGLGYVAERADFMLTAGLIGSVILVSFGAGIFFTPLRRHDLSAIEFSHATGFFLQGVFINIFNPFVFLLWISILTGLHHEPMNVQWVFVGSMLGVVALTDVLKVRFAARLGEYLQVERLGLIKKFSGVLIGGFGILLMVRTLLALT